jgi:hypothetical protein
MKVLVTVLAAFSSGVFGSSIGAIASIVMCAVFALVGIAANAAGSSVDMVSNVAFGILLGPQVSFAPACCALAYAWKKGYIENSKDIFKPLISLRHTDVLLIGGIFGVIGWYFNILLENTVGSKIDCVALSVTIISIMGKWLFGGSPIGETPKGYKRFDVGSECWLPWQTMGNDFNLMVLGIAVSIISAETVLYICKIAVESGNTILISESGLLVWSLGLILLLFLTTGNNVPVFHHIGLCASMTARVIFLKGGNELEVVLWATAIGVLTAYVGDWLGRIFDVHGEGYVDPPTAAIAVVAPIPLWVVSKLEMDNYIVPIIILIIFVSYDIFVCKKCRFINPHAEGHRQS